MTQDSLDAMPGEAVFGQIPKSLLDTGESAMPSPPMPGRSRHRFWEMLDTGTLPGAAHLRSSTVLSRCCRVRRLLRHFARDMYPKEADRTDNFAGKGVESAQDEVERLRIPEDVSVVTVDSLRGEVNDILCEPAHIEQNTRELSDLAIRKLVEQMNGADAHIPQTFLVEPSMVGGGTVRLWKEPVMPGGLEKEAFSENATSV